MSSPSNGVKEKSVVSKGVERWLKTLHNEHRVVENFYSF
jgi:hypothetical protein